jgi:hypothetical protein
MTYHSWIITRQRRILKSPQVNSREASRRLIMEDQFKMPDGSVAVTQDEVDFPFTDDLFLGSIYVKCSSKPSRYSPPKLSPIVNVHGVGFAVEHLMCKPQGPHSKHAIVMHGLH